MGNFLSTSASGPLKQSLPPEVTSTAFLSGGEKASSSAGGALFLSEVKAEPATWSQEGICFTIQRLFGLLPDSAVRCFALHCVVVAVLVLVSACRANVLHDFTRLRLVGVG